MLFIFHVDTGTMMTFDMNLAMENVSVLQSVIAKACHIQEDKQVLLISGGESLDPNLRVGKYSAGTDTNPIFLFSKSTIEAATPPSPSVHYGSDVDLQGQVEGSLIMPPAYETVVSRTQLAVQFRDVDEEEVKACERLVHDQHLQQQGWAAVVANLEDITSALKQRSEMFQEAYANYLEARQDYLGTLASISESLVLLSRIPLLDCLCQGMGIDISVPIAVTGGTDADLIMGQSEYKTLFEWISSQDPQHSLHDMVEQCAKATEQFDRKILDTLNQEVQQTVEAVDNPSMKEVKGLEDRLYGLDQFMSGARKIVQEQADMSKGFVQNQNRASNVRDKSILPDLCASHKKQLVAMLNSHKKLREIKKKCRMAKEELSVNLHTRLRWVMFVEKKICDIDGKLMIYHENLKRLRKRLDILQQIHEAPRVYAELVVEVVRRRKFSSQFLKWAGNLAEESSQVHNEEVKRRQTFLLDLGKHFLQSLFQGFEDSPPKFATEAPAEFDQFLPEITSQDIDMLRNAVPELRDVLKIPTTVPISERMVLQSVLGSVSNSTVHVDQRGSCLPVTVVSSAATSDIDIIQSDSEHQFVHIDNGRMSLGDQVAACDPNTDIIIKPHPLLIADKPDFPVPQSLSETLTQEMSSQVKAKDETAGKSPVPVGKVEKSSDSVDVLHSSGEPTKSVDSDVPSGERSHDSVSGKKHLGKGHLASDTSPEMETSQEFTTADFYIDESMPSSMTDSPPNKQKVTISQQLSEKTQSVAKLEKELHESQQKLSLSEKQIKSLHEILTRDLPKLQELLSSLRDSVHSDRHEFRDYLKTVEQSAVENIAAFHRGVVAANEQVIDLLKIEHDKELYTMKQTLAEKESKILNLEESVYNLNEKLDNAKTDLELGISDLEKKCQEMKEMHEEEKEDLIRKHTLEMEVETDKLEAEYKANLDQHEIVIQEMIQKLSAGETHIQELQTEKDQISEKLTRKFQLEKDEIRHTLESEIKEGQSVMIASIQENMMKENEEKLKKLSEECEKQKEIEIDSLQKTLNEAKENALQSQKKELEETHEGFIEQLTKKLNLEKDEEMKLQSENLQAEFSLKISEAQKDFDVERADFIQKLKELEKLPVESREVQTDAENIMTTDHHQQILNEMKEKYNLEITRQIEMALRDQRQQHEREIEDLTLRLQREKDESVSIMKTSLTAERQVSFNEAVNKVSQEKDRVIEELLNKEAALLAQMEEQNVRLNQLLEERNKAEEISEQVQKLLEEKHEDFCIKEHSFEDEKELLKQQLNLYQQQLLTVSEVSVAPPDVREGASAFDGDSFGKVSELENTLKSKEEEITKLQNRVMELSMTASTRVIAQNKVSITSCNVGDLVLLCLDERHDQYVVFTIGTTLHFLHTDCLDPLGLKTGPGENRKSWVLAHVTDKEYCQAKKPQNRFKVPLGTKFYRVKAKPWTREPSQKDSGSASKS